LSKWVEDVRSNAPEDREEIAINMAAFADYVAEYWVDRNNRLKWNHFDNEGTRTNNHLDGRHSKLKKHASHPHSNIFVLIER
jgi:hypothetical protein